MGRIQLVGLMALVAGCALPAAIPRTNLSFRADESLFTLFAWMNAAGYDDETPGMPMTPFRQAVRQALQDHPQRPRWRQFYRDHSPASGYLKTQQLTDYAFFVTPAPDFTPTVQPLWGGGYFSLFRQEMYVMTRYWGLDRELRDFYRQADIPRLWARFRPQYEALNRQLFKQVEHDIARLDVALRLPAYVPVTVVPNLIGETYVAHTSYSQGQAFLVVHPKPSLEEYATFVRHEYLHPQINPLVEKHRHLIQPKMDQMADLLDRSPAIRADGYDRQSLVEESIIRAIEGVLYRYGSVEGEYRHGFILTRAVADQLPTFISGRETLDRFIERLFKDLDTRLERQRWQRWQAHG